MRLLGIKAYRFSVSWTRIMPQGTGSVNEKAIALYRDMILEMKKNGITPYLTMYHWELPQALQDKGGWLNEEIIQWFGEYAKVVAENFSDICEYFITLNEPQCFVGLGHLSGIQAPGLKLSYKETFQIAHNALRAHGQAVINLRKYAKQPIKVGYAPTCGMAYPVSDKKEDVEAARKKQKQLQRQLQQLLQKLQKQLPKLKQLLTQKKLQKQQLQRQLPKKLQQKQQNNSFRIKMRTGTVRIFSRCFFLCAV